jgi:hypothetical protein
MLVLQEEACLMAYQNPKSLLYMISLWSTRSLTASLVWNRWFGKPYPFNLSQIFTWLNADFTCVLINSITYRALLLIRTRPNSRIRHFTVAVLRTVRSTTSPHQYLDNISEDHREHFIIGSSFSPLSPAVIMENRHWWPQRTFPPSTSDTKGQITRFVGVNQEREPLANETYDHFRLYHPLNCRRCWIGKSLSRIHVQRMFRDIRRWFAIGPELMRGCSGERFHIRMTMLYYGTHSCIDFLHSHWRWWIENESYMS